MSNQKSPQEILALLQDLKQQHIAIDEADKKQAEEKKKEEGSIHPLLRNHQLDYEVIDRMAEAALGLAYLNFLIAQLMVEQGKIDDADFPFISSLTTTKETYTVIDGKKVALKEPVTVVKLNVKASDRQADTHLRKRRTMIKKLNKMRGRRLTSHDILSFLRVQQIPQEVAEFLDQDLSRL